MENPLILLTNDDGIDSPGLEAAALALCSLGRLFVVAPMSQQSGMGRAWLPNSTGTIQQREMILEGRAIQAFAIDGSPVQAVAHALLEILPTRPDLLVSGINYGENLGMAVTSSGTVGAAIEGAISGIPSMAISLEVDKAFYHGNSRKIDFGTAAYFTRFFALRMLSVELPLDVDLLKVEVPRDAVPTTPWETTRLSRRRYFVPLGIEREKNQERARLDYTTDASSSVPGTDTYTLVKERKVAVTPLSLDLTSRVDLSNLARMLSDGCDSSTA